MLAVTAFILGFTAVFLGICGLLAIASGWHGLSRIYPDESESESLRSVWQSISMGGVSYGKGCVHVGIADCGFHLKAFWTFRLMHPPLFIPWTEVTSITPKTWLFHTSYRIAIKRSGVTICFYSNLGKAIMREWQTSRGELPPMPKRFGFVS